MRAAFVLLASLTLASGIGAVGFRKPVHCALSLALSFVGLAGVYLDLGAEFAAFAQVLVYVGAVAVLIVFAVLLTRGTEAATEPQFTPSWVSGLAVSALVAGAILFCLLNSTGFDRAPPPAPPATARLLGDQLMTRYVLPLEVIGLLLTAAMIGAVALALKEKPKQP